VKPVLDVPRRDLTAEVESETGPGMTDGVVDSPEPVERAAVLAPQHGMNPGLAGGGRDLKNSGCAHRGDELRVASIGFLTAGDNDAQRIGDIAARQQVEQVICLRLQLLVRPVHEGLVTGTLVAQVRRCDLAHQIDGVVGHHPRETPGHPAVKGRPVTT
jgi:hypothetical protein